MVRCCFQAACGFIGSIANEPVSFGFIGTTRVV
jgi:hypothetical protein